MFRAIWGFIQRYILPTAGNLLKTLTPVVSDVVVQMAKNKAREWAGRKTKAERRKVQQELELELKQRGYKAGVDFASDEIDRAAKAAVKWADKYSR